MKVLINAVSAHMGGAATYVKNLASELANLDSPDEFIFCTPEALAHPVRTLSPNIRIISRTDADGNIWKRLWFDQVTLRRMIKQQNVDVLYATGNFGMFACPCPQIVLVRNSIYFSQFYLTKILPGKAWRFRLDFKIRRWLICRSMKWATVVVTPSRSILDEMRRFIRGKQPQVEVNPYGTILERFGANASLAKGASLAPENIKLLHVSHYSDHKNLGVLLRSLEILHERGMANVTLSTTANVGDDRYDPASLYRTADLALLQQPIIKEHVTVLGDVTYDKLPALYQDYDIFVFPSLTESYGHPLVEAMASGLPIITADTPISRELCGDSALYFDPLSAEDLASRIQQLSGDANLREQLRESGRLRVESMTWRSHVVRLLELCRALAPGAESKAATSTVVLG